MRIIMALNLPNTVAVLAAVGGIEGCEVVATFDHYDQVARAVQTADADLLLLGGNLEGAAADDLIHALPRIRAATRCRIMVLVGSDPKGITAAIQEAGAEVCTGNITPDSVRQLLTAELSARRAASAVSRPALVAVYGASGGVGTTTIAVNLACRAQAAGIRSCLLDFNLQNPNLHCHLQVPMVDDGGGPAIDPQATLYGLWPALETGRVSSALLRDRLLTVDAGLRILPGPLYDLARIQRLDTGKLEQLLGRLRAGGDFDLVVADTAPLPALQGTFAAMNSASHIVLVTTNLAAHIHDASAAMRQVWDKLGIPRERYLLVINQYREGLCDPGEIATALNLAPVQAAPLIIPYDQRGLVHLACQQGRPLARSRPGHVLAERMDSLLGTLFPEVKAAAAQPAKRRLLWGNARD